MRCTSRQHSKKVRVTLSVYNLIVKNVMKTISFWVFGLVGLGECRIGQRQCTRLETLFETIIIVHILQLSIKQEPSEFPGRGSLSCEEYLSSKLNERTKGYFPLNQS